MQYVLEISYNGTQFHGWQIQKNALTVQAVVDEALSLLLRKPTQTLGSGRTDTGVHARQQFVSFTTDALADAQAFIFKLNALLPQSIAAHHLYVADDAFSVRFDAIQRAYQYHIHLTKDPFLTGQSWHLHHPHPDITLMNEAASILLQYTDFQSFCKYHSAADHFLCTLYHARWTNPSPNQLCFEIRANRFLRGMVRAIVGTLLEVGRGKIPVSEMHSIIQAKDRKYAKSAVPPQGLYLTEVQYPEACLQRLF